MERYVRMAKKKRVLTTGDVARICNVSSRIAVKWIDGGFLQGYRIPHSKDRRVLVTELKKFLEEHNMPMDDFLKDFKEVL